MDIIIYGPDPIENERQAQNIVEQRYCQPFVDCCFMVSMVTATFENLTTQPRQLVEMVLTDNLPSDFHLVGALAEVQKYRKFSNRPDMLAIYCTTVNPLDIAK